MDWNLFSNSKIEAPGLHIWRQAVQMLTENEVDRDYYRNSRQPQPSPIGTGDHEANHVHAFSSKLPAFDMQTEKGKFRKCPEIKELFHPGWCRVWVDASMGSDVLGAAAIVIDDNDHLGEREVTIARLKTRGFASYRPELLRVRF